MHQALIKEGSTQVKTSGGDHGGIQQDMGEFSLEKGKPPSKTEGNGEEFEKGKGEAGGPIFPFASKSTTKEGYEGVIDAETNTMISITDNRKGREIIRKILQRRSCRSLAIKRRERKGTSMESG